MSMLSRVARTCRGEYPRVVMIGLVTAAITLINGGCYYRRKNENYSAVATVTPHFSSIYRRVIAPKCLACHAGDFDTYAGVKNFLAPFDPGRSQIYQQVEAGTMPVSQPMLTDDEILAIYQWINNGAPND